MAAEFPLETVLELACAAQRVNNDYIRAVYPVYSSDGQLVAYKQPNKILIMVTLGLLNWEGVGDPLLFPSKLIVADEDKQSAEEIRKFFRRLMFSAVKGDNEFLTELNSLLNADSVPSNKLGFIACLPSVYKRDYSKHQIEKRIRTFDEDFLAPVGSSFSDKDCEILESTRSKTYDAWNVLAVIDNKMVSWFSKVDLKLGPCVVVKGRVKEHTKHWKFQNCVTRLNYVKAAQ